MTITRINLRENARAERVPSLLTHPYSVALNDRMDRLRMEAPDVHVEEDEGGAAYVVHGAPVELDDTEPRVDESIVRGVKVRDLVTITDPRVTVGEIANMVTELAALGARPCVRFHRNRLNAVDGFTIAREVV